MPGVFGDAITLAANAANVACVHTVVLNHAATYISPERGTIEAWFQQTFDPVEFSHNFYRILDGPWGLSGQSQNAISGPSIGLGSGVVGGGPAVGLRRLSFFLSFGGPLVEVLSVNRWTLRL